MLIKRVTYMEKRIRQGKTPFINGSVPGLRIAVGVLPLAQPEGVDM
jgi:hypothetical protein